MLIIEGPDGVGKTTLAKLLVEVLSTRAPYTYEHLSRLPKTWVSPWSYIDRMHRYCVKDRFHMSEIAYAYARGDSPILTPLGYAMVDGYARLFGAFTIVITASNEHLIDNFGKKFESEMYNLHIVKRANDWFTNCVGDHGEDYDLVVHLDVGDLWPAENCALVDRIVTAYEARQTELDEILSRRQINAIHA